MATKKGQKPKSNSSPELKELLADAIVQDFEASDYYEKNKDDNGQTLFFYCARHLSLLVSELENAVTLRLKANLIPTAKKEFDQ